MDLKQLEALVGIAAHGSFSAAAAALGTVQSNVSGRIARLERELDTSLVERSSGLLTEEGALVASRARHILGELEAIMSATLEPQLLQGQLDFAILTTPIHTPELAVQPLFDEDLVLVLPTEHPLALKHPRGAAPVRLKELDGIEMLLPLQGTALREEIDQTFGLSGITPLPSIELDGLRTLASLVFDGYGPAILPATAVPDSMRAQFRLLRLEGFPRRHVGIVSRRHGLPSAPTRAVREVLLDLATDSDAPREGLHAPRP